MSQHTLPAPPGTPYDRDNHPYRLGWRYRRITLSDGTIDYEVLPLQPEDLLHPEEGDCEVHRPDHQRDAIYCQSALETFFRNAPDVLVLGDCCIDFGVPGIRNLGPDIVLFENAPRGWDEGGTYYVAVSGGRPLFVLEVTSPVTYNNDFEPKLDLYYRVGVYKYVILSRGRDGEQPAHLVGFVRGDTTWEPLPPNEQGRLDLDPIPLWLGVEDDHPWYYEKATGKRLPDLTQATEERDAEAQARVEADKKAADALKEARDADQAREKAEQKAREEAQAREEADKKAADALNKARDAAQAREEADKKARDEAQARGKAEKKAQDEAQAREKAEKKAREETQAREEADKRAREAEEDRLRLAERLRALEEEFQRRLNP